ncbi:MAG: anthranilate synthase component I family protein, partial [bacterium]
MEALRGIGVTADPRGPTGSRALRALDGRALDGRTLDGRTLDGFVDGPLDPEQVAACLQGRRHVFLLDSADPSHADGRYSMLGCDPWCVLRARGEQVWAETDQGRVEFRDPLEALSAVTAALRVDTPPPDGLPLAGGAVGFFGYDLGRAIEVLPERTVDDLGTDELCLAFYDWMLVFDHLTSRWHLVGTSRRPEVQPLESLLGQAEALIAQLVNDAPELSEPPALPPAQARSNFTHTEYVAAVERALEHIYAGDIYQVNLSQRFAVAVSAPAFELYRRLRHQTRAVFSAYLEGVNMHVLSLSPERFLRTRGRRVETCPIKGTRPRGRTPAEDKALAAELCGSAKDAAELAMIVDLERNDLGRVCEAGSVQVTEHAALYTLATVH